MKIKLARTPADLETCLAIRRVVFIEEQNVPEELEVDGDDAKCTHILAEVNAKPAGAARFQYIGDSAKIQRVAVLPEYRGKGAGAEIIRFIISRLRDDGQANYAKLGSQTHALRFYEKLGFSAFGDEYMDAGIPHMDMKLKL